MSQIEVGRKQSADPEMLHARFDSAFGKVVAKRNSMMFTDGRNRSTSILQHMRQLLSILFCKVIFRSTAKVAASEMIKPDVEKNNQKVLNFEEVNNNAIKKDTDFLSLQALNF